MRTAGITFSMLLLSASAFAQMKVTEEEFSVTNPLDGTVLHGTLTLPEKEMPKALIILATGSGLQDRDETIGRHKPFRDIANYLTSNGYAVARSDDRGYGNPIDTMLIKRSTQWDELADYRSIMGDMKSRDNLKSIPVGLLGHSLGGSEAIMCFSTSDKSKPYNSVGVTPEFIITLAAPAVAGDLVLLDQARQQLRLQNTEYAYDMLKPVLEQRYRWAKSFMPDQALRAALYDDVMKQIPPGTELPDQYRRQIDAEIEVFCSPSYREMLRYDPSEDINLVSVPWLALYGSKDSQVSVPLNSDPVIKAAETNGNITVAVLEGKNHLFQNANTGSVEEYQAINGTVSDDTLQEILEWLEQQFNRK